MGRRRMHDIVSCRCLLYSLLGLLFLFGGVQCTDRYTQFTEDASARLHFSADTLRLDTLFSRLSSSTFGVMVYNRNDLALLLKEVRLASAAQSGFRINVDGRSGTRFQNITLPGRDSIFIFVEATFPEGASNLPELQEDDILLSLGQREQKIHLEAWRQNIYRHTELIVERDTVFTADRPIYIVDSLVVAEGATLTIQPNAHILLADRGRISVRGSLQALGAADKRIMIEGIRRDNLIPKVNYRLVPGQWEYILFTSTSKDNKLHYTTIRNGRGGVRLQGESANTTFPSLDLKGAVITNMKGNAIGAKYGSISMENSELSNTLAHTLELHGGKYRLNHCTIINLYPWDTRQGTALRYSVEEGNGSGSQLEVTNTIVDGSYSVLRSKERKPSGGEIQIGEGEVPFVLFRNCYLRAPLDLWDVFHNSIEASLPPDKVYHRTGRDKQSNKYDFIYEYRPLPSAPFVGKAVGFLPTDLDGRPRAASPTIGAYEPSEPQTETQQ